MGTMMLLFIDQNPMMGLAELLNNWFHRPQNQHIEFDSQEWIHILFVCYSWWFTTKMKNCNVDVAGPQVLEMPTTLLRPQELA